jgi:hypothetical protein
VRGVGVKLTSCLISRRLEASGEFGFLWPRCADLAHSLRTKSTRHDEHDSSTETTIVVQSSHEVACRIEVLTSRDARSAEQAAPRRLKVVLSDTAPSVSLGSIVLWNDQQFTVESIARHIDASSNKRTELVIREDTMRRASRPNNVRTRASRDV